MKVFRNQVLNNRVAQIANDLGEEIDHFLGGGAYGFAFKTISGKVIKLTSDESEVHIAYKLAKSKNWMKSIVNFYNVGKIKIKIDPTKQTTLINQLSDNLYNYYILMDFVQPLRNKEEKDAIECYRIINKKPNYYELISDKQEVMEHIDWMTTNDYDVGRMMVNNIDVDKVKQLAIDFYPKILNLTKELKKHHVNYIDFHCDNVGWDKDYENLILFDIGDDIKTRFKFVNFKEFTTFENLITKFKKFNKLS